MTVTSAPLQGTSQVFYIYSDQINTAREITNAAGVKVWQADPDPFGANLPNENPAGQGKFTYNPRFPGQYFDRETGLHYNFFRDYDPQTGRYVESDPIGLKGGLNTYAYVRGDPIVSYDPYGLATVHIWNPTFSGNVGHASMTLNDGTYISWWPRGADARIYNSVEGMTVGSLDEDASAEERDPDRSINVDGLDEGAIRVWWSKFRRFRPKYSFLGQNCAKTVGDGMTAAIHPS